MSELSPAAEVVMAAFDNTYESDKCAVANALRAAVDQVVPVTPKPNDTFCCPPVDSIVWKNLASVRGKLLTIADELESVKYGTYRCDLKGK